MVCSLCAQNVGFHNFSLNNVSASAAFGYRLDLRALSEDVSFMDYTEYEPEQWKGLYYRLPVDPTKTISDLLPSYATMIAARRKNGEQFSTAEFLGTGEHALIGRGKLNYYNTTGTAGGRAPKASAAGAKPAPLRLPPSLHGQILTATIYANGRLTLTGVRREKDVRDAYVRLFSILRAFATSEPPLQPASPPPYVLPYTPGQRRASRVKREPQQSPPADNKYAVGRLRDIKPNISSDGFVAPITHGPVRGTFAVKAEPNNAAATSLDALPAAPFSAAPADSFSTADSAPPLPSAAALDGATVKSEPSSFLPTSDWLPGGESMHTAIVLDGLPDHANAAATAQHEDVEWE